MLKSRCIFVPNPHRSADYLLDGLEAALVQTLDDLIQTAEYAAQQDYDFPAFFDDYRVGLIYGWVIPVFAVGSLDVSSERAMTLWTNVVERVQDAIFQHGAQRFVDLG